MLKIQMVDTKNQYLKIKDEIDAAISEVLNNTQYINGPIVNLFAEHLANFLEVKYVIPCANGTDALQIALMSLNLQPGDEIITPSFTYIATVEVIGLLKLKPIFVDVDPISFCIDEKLIESQITLKTKAIIPVHLFGQSANMEKIMEIAKKHNLFVIEDNAQAIGADYTFSDGSIKKTGTIGTIGITSFYPSKNLGCFGDGGAICTNDSALATTLKMITNHGQSKRYYHDIIGCNSRLDSIQAAVLHVKLKYLHEYTEARRKVANFYSNKLSINSEIIIPKIQSYSTHVFNQYTIQIDANKRQGLIDYLAKKDIPTMIYYPVPAHLQKMFTDIIDIKYNLKITETLSAQVLSLPIHTEMDEEQLNFITYEILDYLKIK